IGRPWTAYLLSWRGRAGGKDEPAGSRQRDKLGKSHAARPSCSACLPPIGNELAEYAGAAADSRDRVEQMIDVAAAQLRGPAQDRDQNVSLTVDAWASAARILEIDDPAFLEEDGPVVDDLHVGGAIVGDAADWFAGDATG